MSDHLLIAKMTTLIKFPPSVIMCCTSIKDKIDFEIYLYLTNQTRVVMIAPKFIPDSNPVVRPILREYIATWWPQQSKSALDFETFAEYISELEEFIKVRDVIIGTNTYPKF